MIQLINGDSFEELDKFKDNYFSSIVTDPPYELTSMVKRFGKKDSAPAKEGTDGRFSRLSKGFMGQEWDGTGIQRDPDFWSKVLRVLKPGGYALVFGGTRTFYRTACAIEDAGFIIRDTICWLQSQGFPKSHSLEDGWGTALKPGFEPVIVAQKPISEKTYLDNFKKWGTGGINIEGSRIELNGEIIPINKLEKWSGFGQEIRPDYQQELNTKGRWPSNVILDEGAGEMLDKQTGVLKSGFMKADTKRSTDGGYQKGFPKDRVGARDTFGDVGGASRFFYCAKASKAEKEIDGQSHPTTKPISLMKYLITLVTPPNSIVLDCFMGGGSTGLACQELGFDFVGIEKEKEYFEISQKRMKVFA